MNNQLRKEAVYGLITNIYYRFKKLSQEFEVILDSVERLQQSEKRNTHLNQAVQEIVTKLEQQGHAQKLVTLAETLDELRQNVAAASPDSDFSEFLPRVTRVQEEADAHFREFIPEMTEKLRAARHYQVEIN